MPKQIGEFSSKLTSLTSTPGPAGSIVIQGNIEGSATGFGTVAGTGSVVGGFKSATLSYCGASYLDNGDGLTVAGAGTYGSVGKHRWRTQAILQISDGQTIAIEGEMDLAPRSWNGKMFEK